MTNHNDMEGTMSVFEKSAERASEVASTVGSAVARGAGRAGDYVSGLNDSTLRMVRARPLTALLAAVAIGFIVGRVISRR